MVSPPHRAFHIRGEFLSQMVGRAGGERRQGGGGGVAVLFTVTTFLSERSLYNRSERLLVVSRSTRLGDPRASLAVELTRGPRGSESTVGRGVTLKRSEWGALLRSWPRANRCGPSKQRTINTLVHHER